MAKSKELKLKKVKGGYEYEPLGIHVVAETEKEAKQHIKDFHGIDVDTFNPDPKADNPKPKE